jgi:hypothetical protein
MRERLARASALAVVCSASVAAAKPKIDPIAAAAAKACGLPVARIMPTEAPTERTPPADAQGGNGTWDLRTDDGWVRWYDNDDDGRVDTRERELDHPDSDVIDCEIDERWAGGRWHLVKVTGYDGIDATITTFKNDRPVHVDKQPEMMQ